MTPERKIVQQVPVARLIRGMDLGDPLKIVLLQAQHLKAQAFKAVTEILRPTNRSAA